MKRVVLPAIAGALALASSGGFAAPQTASQTFQVKLKINDLCTINKPADLSFPDQTFLTSGTIDGTTSVTVNCTKGTSATIGLTSTTGFTMSNGTDTISYGLFKDSAHSQTWDGSSTQAVTGSGVDASGNSSGSTNTFTIYGHVPAQQTNTTGQYADTVTATVTF